MMKRLSMLFALCLSAYAQGTVYLRSSGPASVIVNGATNATPIVISTASAHGFASTCGVSTVCKCDVEGVGMGTGASPVNGVHECHYVDSTHLSLYDLTNTPIAGTGNYVPNNVPVLYANPFGGWVSAVTDFATVANPAGYLDGPAGNLTRRVALGPDNGMTSIVVSSCPACVITVTTSYDPTAGNYPISTGAKFSVSSTGTALDTCGVGGGAQSPYTVASASTSGWVSSSFTCSGLSNGDYTNVNLHCGPSTVPNDLIGGTASCTRVSQMAYVGNPYWDNLLTNMTRAGVTSSPAYKSTFDGGSYTPNPEMFDSYSMAAIRFLVEPTSTLNLAITMYALNHLERIGGVNFTQNESSQVISEGVDVLSPLDMEGISILYAVGSPYWDAAEKTTGLNKMYNDLDDSTVTQCTKANVDTSTGHNFVLATGSVASGTNDATHVTLAAGDSQPDSYYNGTIIALANGFHNNTSGWSYGRITAYDSTTKVATVASFSSGYAHLDNWASGTYTSGLSCTGSTGQSAGLYNSVGGGVYGYVLLTGTNTIAGGSPIVVTNSGSGIASPFTTMGVWSQGTAVCTGTATVSATIGTPYTIFDSVTASSTVAGATATYTFTKTTGLSSYYHIGDAVMGHNGWGQNTNLPQVSESYVTAVGSNTLTTINGAGITASSTPTQAWIIPAWTAGDCGMMWDFKHALGTSWGVPQTVYGPTAGIPVGTIISEGTNFGAGDLGDALAVDLVAAGDDARAARDATLRQAYLFDYEWRHYMDYSGGWVHSGSGYSIDAITGSIDLQTWMLTQSVPTFPDLDFTGPWMQGTSLQKMFEYYPDLQGGLVNVLVWGGGTYYNIDPGGVLAQGLTFDGAFSRAPKSDNAKYFRNWLENVSGYGSAPYSLWGGNGVEFDRTALGFLHNPPSIGSSDYTAQPTQHVWDTSSSAACASLTGWPCNQFRGDAMISRTGWRSKTDSLLLFDARTFTNEYDSPNGTLRLYKNGPLLFPDTNPPGTLWVMDPSTIADAVQFGGPQPRWDYEFLTGLENNFNIVGKTTINRWAGSQSGAWDSHYGDSQSRYAYSCADMAPAYNTGNLGITIAYSRKCAAHFKKAGWDEFVFQFDDTSNSSTPVATHLHYNQTGQTIAGPNMTTGTTICTDTVGTQVNCGTGLDTYRTIKSVQSGLGTPAETNGLLTHVDSPNTIKLTWDCPGSGNAPQCTASPLSTYTGGNGWTDRITIAGGTSVAANVTSFTDVIEHKIMQTLSDATFTTAAVNPDANFTGGMTCGALSCAVYLDGRNNATHATLTSFSASPTVAQTQYLIGGLTPGTYTPTINGSAVSTCNGTAPPCTVAAGDNSLYFEDSHTGSLTVGLLSGGAPSSTGSAISGTMRVSGTVIIH